MKAAYCTKEVYLVIHVIRGQSGIPNPRRNLNFRVMKSCADLGYQVGFDRI